MKIPLLNIDIGFKKKAISTLPATVAYADFTKMFDSMMTQNSPFNTARSQLDPVTTLNDDISMLPWYPIPVELLYHTAKYSDVIRTIHQSLRKEIFRHGYVIKEKFALKCKQCGKEFKNPINQCDECQSTELRAPNLSEKRLLQDFCKNINDNDQDILQVSEEINDDLEVIDDGYMLFIKQYYWSPEGKMLGAAPVELLRSDPKFMRLIADRMGRPGRDASGEFLYFCPEHRNDIIRNQTTCSKCGKEMFLAYFKSLQPDGKIVLYGKDEVCHKSKYNPSLTYGTSVMYSSWTKIMTLTSMDTYMKNYYTKQRPPRGLLFVNTPNMESLEKAWKWMLDEYKKNPHQIPPIAIEQAAGSKGSLVNFIDMMKGLDEMQYVETRNEMRRQIGAGYGVMPLFQADVSASGGLNNEGLQITVTNRAVQDGQGVYNDGYYPWICKQLEVKDYEIELEPNEEQDLAAKEELRSKRIENARKMQEMGFEVTLKSEGETEQGLFEFAPVDKPVQKPNMGGMPGMGAPGMPPMGEPLPEESQGFEGQPEEPPPPDQGFAQKDLKKDKVYFQPGEDAPIPEIQELQKELAKGKVYLPAGKQPPQGAKVYQGTGGARYYDSFRTAEGPSIHSLLNKPVESMNEAEQQRLREHIAATETQYTTQDLEYAKKFLQRHPQLRARYGNKYYEFAVQVAEAIHRGEDPEATDWQSLDSQIPLGQSLRDERYAELTMSMKKDAMVTTTTTGAFNPRHNRKENLYRLYKSLARELAKDDEEFQRLEKATGDPEDLKQFIERALYSRSFEGVSKSISELIKDYILHAIVNKKISKEKAIEYITSKGIDDSQAENIFRTESQALNTKVREWSYKKLDPEGTLKYIWGGPDDSRTTFICKNITKRTSEGVTLEELKRIISDEVEKAKGRGELPSNYDVREYTPHFSCRHTFWRKF